MILILNLCSSTICRHSEFCTQVYLLVRSKRGSDPAHRVQALLQSEIFHPFQKLLGYEQQASKVCAVAANITYPQLGLTPENLQMLQRYYGTF